uniref:NADH deshydrogenase subunit 6 n=1 Tax=Libnetis granicollis TaxID=343789 RepID=A0A0S2MQZ7_9COLE|nr:NADH deshydrogenase subunit 6 [Libnetis granicollis]
MSKINILMNYSLHQTLSMLMTISSSMFLFSKHPLTMGLLMMNQTIMLALMINYMNENPWFPFIIFIIIVGGLMVLFLYMTSITANKKFKFSWWLIPTTITPLFINTNYQPNYQIKMLETMLIKYFSMPNCLIMVMIMAFLLITLIAVVKLTKTNFGALRQH